MRLTLAFALLAVALMGTTIAYIAAAHAPCAVAWYLYMDSVEDALTESLWYNDTLILMGREPNATFWRNFTEVAAFSLQVEGGGELWVFVEGLSLKAATTMWFGFAEASSAEEVYEALREEEDRLNVAKSFLLNAPIYGRPSTTHSPIPAPPDCEPPSAPKFLMEMGLTFAALVLLVEAFLPLNRRSPTPLDTLVAFGCWAAFGDSVFFALAIFMILFPLRTKDRLGEVWVFGFEALLFMVLITLPALGPLGALDRSVSVACPAALAILDLARDIRREISSLEANGTHSESPA